MKFLYFLLNYKKLRDIYKGKLTRSKAEITAVNIFLSSGANTEAIYRSIQNSKNNGAKNSL